MGKYIGDKDDSGDLLKRIVMKDPAIEPPTGRANKAVLEFVKSTDDFASRIRSRAPRTRCGAYWRRTSASPT